LNLVLDGLIYQRQQVGGVSRIFTEILPRMCELDSTLEVSIVTTKELKQPLPTHKNMRQQDLFPIDNYLKPAWFWREFDLRSKFINWKIGSGKETIWHSTYFTRLDQWVGKEVVTVYDLIYELYPEYFKKYKDEKFRAIKRKCIMNADAVLCISRNTQKDLVEFYGLPVEKTHVVPIAYNPIFKQNNVYQPSTLLPNNKPFLLYVGTRMVYKNFLTLIKGYSVWKYRNDVDVVVVGSEWSEGEKEILSHLKIDDNIHLVSNIADELLVNLYNQALAFVFPSEYEGFGIPLLEAMACGCPIVASRIPASLEVAGEIPFYFESSEIDSLLSALDSIYKKDNVDQKITVGLKHVKNYSWDRTARETLSIYQALSTS